MKATQRVTFALTATLFVIASAAAKADELYAPPSADDVRSRAVEWVAAQGVKDQAVLEEVGKIWALGEERPTARELFDKTIETFSAADPPTKQLVEACNLLVAPLVPPDAAPLARDDMGDFYQANLKLFYARYLTQRRMYDEALEVFEQIDPQHVVDPSSCFFYESVCRHQLLMRDEGLAVLDKLLKNTEDVPPSYSTVATLMQYDLQALQEKTLGQVAKKMSDSERRLDLGRGGQKVQKVQGEIVAILDEIIEKLEQQSGGGGGGGGSGQSNQNQSSSPAQDSQVKGATAPGEVDRKNFKNEADWGNLPAKEIARAKSHIDRNFPPHYQQAWEAYSKEAAKRRANSGR